MSDYHVTTTPVLGCLECRHDIKRSDDGSNAWALTPSRGDRVFWTTSGAQIAFKAGHTPCSNNVTTIAGGPASTPCVIDSGASGGYDYTVTTSLVGIKCAEDPKIIIQPQGGLWLPLMLGIFAVLVTAFVAYRMGTRAGGNPGPNAP